MLPLALSETASYRFISPYECKHGGWDGATQMKRIGRIKVIGI